MKRVAIIHTGGTFVMEKNVRGRLSPGHLALKSIQNHLLPRYPDITVEQFELFNLDSSFITPEHWKLIVEKINELYSLFDGFVIIHGTDTLAYSAAALSFMLKNLGKAVVFTGSQLPFIDRRSDAFGNLASSLEVILDGAIKEVVVVFNNKTYRGNRIKKRDVWDFHAFYSPNFPVLIKHGINLEKKTGIFLDPGEGQFEVDERICKGILFISFFPGIDLSFYVPIILEGSIRGIVVEGYGSGNIPSDSRGLDSLFSRAFENKIPVVICSQSPKGEVNLNMYEAAEKAGFYGLISAGDMTREAAIVKLMIALGRYTRHKDIVSFMTRSVAGERSLTSG